MPDDLRIPAAGPGVRAPVSSSYRARRAGPATGGLPLGLLAAGAGGALLLGVAGWAVMGRRPAVVPVIEAESSPIRVKPENPGGMQVAGADELGDGGGDKMAPGAETPAPQALRAQMQQTGPAPDAALPPDAAPAPAPVPLGPAAPGPTVPPPRRGAIAGSLPPGTAAAAPHPPAAPPARAAGGSLTVQLGALGSEAAARAQWDKLVRTAPDALGGRQPLIEKTEHDGHTLWRLRTGGFSDVADATGFCAKLRAKGGACTIASF